LVPPDAAWYATVAAVVMEVVRSCDTSVSALVKTVLPLPSRPAAMVVVTADVLVAVTGAELMTLFVSTTVNVPLNEPL